MGLLLGYGEYERADVEIRRSTIEARRIFLNTLLYNRRFWADELLTPFYFRDLPAEFHNDDGMVAGLRVFLPYLLDEELHNRIITPINNTPLMNYYSFLSSKKSILEKWENNKKLQKGVDSSDSIESRKIAIQKIIPGWKKLTSLRDSENLCKSLSDWAEKYNLNEEWFLDFALKALCKFKSNSDERLPKIDLANLSKDAAFYYERRINESIKEGVSSYCSKQSWNFTFKYMFDKTVEYPPFEYRWRSFEIPPITWFLQYATRKEFCENIRKNLNETIYKIRETCDYWRHSYENREDLFFEKCKNELESYCDYIEKQKSEKVDEANFQPLIYEHIDKFIWYPSKQTRPIFVEETLTEIKTQLEKVFQIEKSLESFTKRHFERALRAYCQKIEEMRPSNLVKTPRKYSDQKHFEWLIEFQIPPNEKSYSQISKENNVDVKSVREAIIGLAKIIGIKLRQAKQSGRPKGSKDSEKSLRKIGVFKN